MKVRGGGLEHPYGTLAWFAALALLMAPALCAGQSVSGSAPAATSNQADKDPALASKRKEKKELRVADLTRVNTAESARQAAEDVARKKNEKGMSESSPSGSVLEFHALPPGASPGSTPAIVDTQKSGGGLKNIHGEVYGAAADNGKAVGAAAGASSKSGKVSVYIETQHTTSNQTPPQQ